MEAFAAEKLATRKLIEHKGQSFFRNNNLKAEMSSEKVGNTLRVTWVMKENDLENQSTETKEDIDPKYVTVAVDMENGESIVVEDTL